VGDLLLLALLPGGDDLATALVVEHDRAALAFVEIAGVDLAAVDQGEGEPIRQHGAKLFLEIQRQRGAAGTHGMQETELGIESDRLGRRSAVVHQHGVEEGDQGIEAVPRRAAVRPSKAKLCRAWGLTMRLRAAK
jgi:hypothetical protein